MLLALANLDHPPSGLMPPTGFGRSPLSWYFRLLRSRNRSPRRVRTLEDVEGQGRLVDRHVGHNPGTVDRSDAAMAREMLKIVRRSIERHGGP